MSPMSDIVRHPAVAGRFYPRNPQSLTDEVRSYLLAENAAQTAIGCIIPHAGYMYSGHVAGAVYAGIRVPRRCVILCPNHTGMGTPLSIMSSGRWETPLGEVAIDSDLASELKRKFPGLSEDMEAHRTEHAIEVQLPFLQVLQPDLRFVPIALGMRDFEILADLGVALAEAVVSQHDPVLIIASSDMNHYENDTITRAKDQKAVDRMLQLDAAGLFGVVMREEISMCGFGPAVTMLTASKSLGAQTAKLVKYATSGDVSGDRRVVVGYAGIVVR